MRRKIMVMSCLLLMPVQLCAQHNRGLADFFDAAAYTLGYIFGYQCDRVIDEANAYAYDVSREALYFSQKFPYRYTSVVRDIEDLARELSVEWLPFIVDYGHDYGVYVSDVEKIRNSLHVILIRMRAFRYNLHKPYDADLNRIADLFNGMLNEMTRFYGPYALRNVVRDMHAVAVVMQHL